MFDIGYSNKGAGTGLGQSIAIKAAELGAKVSVMMEKIIVSQIAS
jgi:hypothetical protein